MTDTRKRWLRRLLILPPLALGIAVLVWQAGDRGAPEVLPDSEMARPARVTTLQAADFTPRALAYGIVEPATVWNAVAEVSGRIVYRHPELESGNILPAETVVFRIDPADYQLAVTRLGAQLASAEADLAELEVQEANARNSLAIEERAAALADEDLQRQQTLRARGTVSQAAVDAAEQAALTSRQRVQDLENTLALIPVQRRVLEASIAVNQAQLEEAGLDLERTEIRLPIDARIAEVNAEVSQFVSVGETLAVGDGIETAEITAQIAPDQFWPLMAALDLDVSDMPTDEFLQLREQIGLTAEVRLAIGNFVAHWPAQFNRVRETVDPQTRTIGVVVVVDEPLRNAIPGVRPPLTKNMYVEVALTGRPLPDRIVVPRVALHLGADGGQVVYLVDGDGRLEIRPVTVAFVQGDLALVAGGLAAGDRVIVSDLIPAIEGMLIEATEDETLTGGMLATAAGEDPVR